MSARETNSSPAELVNALGLQPHPEGGFFRETYRSSEKLTALPSRFPGERCFSTGIYYLLLAGDFSAFHRIRSDEMWHFYRGGPLLIHVLDPAHPSPYRLIELGEDHRYQAVVPAGAWFAAEPLAEYSLVGCTVAPGFDFADFEMARREALLGEFPAHAEMICRLTREA